MPQLKASGISGVILKGQEGITYQDPLYAQRIQEFKAAGIPVLAEYLYYHPEDAAEDQVKNVVNNCQGEKDVVVDLEWMKGTQAWAGDPAANEANVKVTLALLEIAGFKVRIYTSHAFISQCLPNASWLSQYALWVAWYEAAPPLLPTIWTSWWAWQYTNKGTIPGVSGFVDLSYLAEPAQG
jgi:GH25 family lysozyme M1 (1,4-beta-N-acetylmuramidase)